MVLRFSSLCSIVKCNWTVQVSRTSCACWDRLLATPSPPPACLSTSHHPSPLLLRPEILAGLALGGLVTCLTLFLVLLVYIINLAFNLVIHPNDFLKLDQNKSFKMQIFFYRMELWVRVQIEEYNFAEGILGIQNVLKSGQVHFNVVISVEIIKGRTHSVHFFCELLVHRFKLIRLNS